MKKHLFFLLSLLLLLCGCNDSESSLVSRPPVQAPQVATIQINQVLLRSVPQEVTQQRFTGFDSQGQVRYGPETRDKAATVELGGVSTAVVRLQIEYLQGDTVIGLGSVAVNLTPGEMVEVNNPPFQDVTSALSSLQVTPGGATIADGSAQQFTVIGTFADNTQLDLTSSVTWSSSNPATATINPSGLATAVDPGETTITAAVGPVTDSTTLTVSTATISSVQITPATPLIAAGTTQAFTATATLSDGTTLDVTTSASWTSGNTAAATIVSNTGVATGVASGQSTISATTGGVSGSATLTVSNASVTSLVISPGNPTLVDGTTQQFQVLANFTSGPSQDVTSSATWDSSNDSIATISSTGMAAAQSPGGPVTIEASFGGQSVDTNLTVTDAEIASIEITPANPSIADGTDQQFTALATLTNGDPLDVTGTATWTSGTTPTATIAPGGLATSIDPGQTIITAESGGVQGTTTLTVTQATVTGIAVTPPNPTVSNGISQQFVAIAIFTDNSTQDVTSSAIWSSGTPGVATITSPGGLATAVTDSGSSVITASFGGENGSATLTASDATVESIAVTPNPAVLGEGETQQFTAVASLSDGSAPDVTSMATWVSDDTNVATVAASSGLASTAGVGATQITATFGGQTGSANIVVTEATLQSLTINPPEALSTPGTKRQYRAIGNYSDGATRDLTSQVTWSSNNTDVTLANDNLGPNSIGQASIRLGAPYTGNGTPITVTATLGSVDGTATLYLGAFAYVANGDSDSVSAFTIDPATGALSAGTSAPAADDPTAVTVDPTGRFAYVSANDPVAVSVDLVLVYAINPATGALTQVSSNPVGNFPNFVTVDPTGQFVYVVNQFSGRVSVFTRDPNTGALTAGGTVSTGVTPGSITVDPTGRFAYVPNAQSDNIFVYAIDPNTGALSNVATVNTGSFVLEVAFDPAGRFAYVTNRTDNNVLIYNVDSATGGLTAVNTIGAGNSPFGIALDPTGRFAYVTNFHGDTVSVYTTNPITGELTAGTAVPAGVSPTSIAVDPTGRFAYVANFGGNSTSVYTINPTTGALTAGTAVSGSAPGFVTTTP